MGVNTSQLKTCASNLFLKTSKGADTLLAILKYTEECFWINSPGRCLCPVGIPVLVLTYATQMYWEKDISLSSSACVLQNSYYKQNHNSGNAVPWLGWKFGLRGGPGHTAEWVHLEQTVLMWTFIKSRGTETKVSQSVWRWDGKRVSFPFFVHLKSYRDFSDSVSLWWEMLSNALINDILELCICLNLSPPVHSHSKKSDDPPNLQVNVSLSYQWLLDYYSSYPSGNTKDPFGRQGAIYMDNTAHGLLTIMSKMHVSGCATVSMSTMEVSVLVDHQDGETDFCQSRHAAC